VKPTSSVMPTVKPFFGWAFSSSNAALASAGEILRGEAVAAADRHAACVARFPPRSPAPAWTRRPDNSGSPGAWLLGLFDHGDGPHRGGRAASNCSARKRPEQPHLQHAHLLAAATSATAVARTVSPPNPSARSPARRLPRPVFEQTVMSSGQRRLFVHRRLHDAGQCGIERVHRLARLEEGVRVMRGAADERPMPGDSARRDERARDRRRSWRGSGRRSSTRCVLTSCEVRKPSKKCMKGTRASSVAACAISAEIVRLLHRGGGQQGEAGGARAITSE
jgi:hypothetical protein